MLVYLHLFVTKTRGFEYNNITLFGLKYERRDNMAIINVSPSTNISTLIASASVSEGDVLLLEEGVYYQSVVISKNNIRIVGENCRAVFNGSGFLASAFILNGVSGVEIFGVTMRDYIGYGVYINGGSANRIVSNAIFDIEGPGIFAVTSTANLIWKNRIRNVSDGVFLGSVSTGNQVIENFVRDCSNDGLEAFLSEDTNNAFIGNKVEDCEDHGIEVFGANCLVYHNHVCNAVNLGYYLVTGRGIVSIENHGEHNQNGCVLIASNAFVARNDFSNNRGRGLDILSSDNIIQSNLIKENRDSGLVLESFANNNFIYNNRIVCNTPIDIVTGGTGNNFLSNQTGCRSR